MTFELMKLTLLPESNVSNRPCSVNVSEEGQPRKVDCDLDRVKAISSEPLAQIWIGLNYKKTVVLQRTSTKNSTFIV